MRQLFSYFSLVLIATTTLASAPENTIAYGTEPASPAPAEVHPEVPASNGNSDKAEHPVTS